MLIQGSSDSDRLQIIAKKYCKLRLNGLKCNEILTVVLNPYKKNLLINTICALKEEFREEKLNILTFLGLCNKTFLDNWEFIANLTGTEKEEKPNLCGLEVSQFIFRQSIKEADFSDYISKVNLLHQLFRRYSLIVQNCLNSKEIDKLSQIAKEAFAYDAQKAIDDYKIKTNKLRSFDYLRQMAVLPLIYNNTDYFKNIKFLLIDNADEFSFSFWQFVNAIMPNLSDYLIAYDKDGSSRCGYLCAYKTGVSDFKKKYNPKIYNLIEKSSFYDISSKFCGNIKKGVKTSLFCTKNSIKRLEMIENALKDIDELIKSGVKPFEIAVITPNIDEVLTEEFARLKCKYQILCGSEKLIDFELIRHIISILKLKENIDLKEFELKNLLINLLKIPFKKCIEIINDYSKNKKLKQYKFEKEKYNFAYTKMLALIESLKVSKLSLPEEIQVIFSNLPDNIKSDKNKYEFFIKEAQSFEKAFKNEVKNLTEAFISQIQNSLISENTYNITNLDRNAVIIGTAQKIIDYSLKTRYQLWLDVSSYEWLKQDTGTLYNSWVFNRDWDKDEYTFEDNIILSRDKTARTVRKLILNASEEITFYSSLYDNLGNENFSGLSDFIENSKSIKKEFSIIPRKDQKPVLDYKEGKTAVTAVPGAGKTTILLALVMKLIKQKIPPENIFILTYMESAAKNFKERLKLLLPDYSSLPNISTIHGLALRIIKENGNYVKIGLDENFEICDDNLKDKIIKEIFYKEKINDEKFDDYVKCISIVKLAGSQKIISSKYKEIDSFYKFFNEYNKALKTNNLIDYDDMLCFAFKLLNENEQILRYYQNLSKYIIEDEAQDSTILQQKLIKLLIGKYNNLLRCGDINQAITSTFTNSSLDEFKSFIQTNHNLEMTSSQRSSKPIYSLANRLIKESLLFEETKNAFFDIQINGTTNNPSSCDCPQYLFFEKEAEEKNFILKKIQEIISNNPKASIALLLRLNYQVNEYNEFFQANGLKTSIRSDCLSQKRIYKIILEVLKTIQNPLCNSQILKLASVLELKKEDCDFIQNLKTSFINLNIDNIESQNLQQLYWDIEYWLNNSTSQTDITALNIGLYYSKNAADKSNARICVSVLRKLMTKNQTDTELINNFEYIADKPSSMYKFFDDETQNNEYKINIMTMHKSKGDEFDYVFCPCMNEENYSISLEYVKLKSGSHFVQTIKSVQTNQKIKSNDELKKEQIQETLRLIYVGITRAKKGLFLTNACNYKKRKNTHSIKILNKIILENQNYFFNNISHSSDFDKNKCYNSSN